jgi:hypothetical protein
MIFSLRKDGLTERINALLNAYILSDSFGYPYYFSWPENKFVQTDKDHCVPDGCDSLFSEAIINNHLLETSKIESSSNLSGLTVNPSEFESDFIGHFSFESPLVVKTRPPKDFIIDNHKKNKIASYFREELFTDSVSLIFDKIDTIFRSSEFDAVHFRGGDVIYGHHRLHGAYAKSKTIPLPFCLKLLDYLSVKGERPIVLFGANNKLLARIAQDKCSALVFSQILDLNVSPDIQMLAEAYFMSQCKNVYGAIDSGVVYLAERIGGVKVVAPEMVFSYEEIFLQLKESILNTNSNKFMDVHQKSHSICYAYAIGCANNSFEILDSILCAGINSDQEMPLFLFIRLFNAIRFNKSELVDDIFTEIKIKLSLNNYFDILSYCASSFKVKSFISRPIRISSGSKLFGSLFDEKCMNFINQNFDMGIKK